MALDATAREANFKDSIKKFCIDRFQKSLGYPCRFDRNVSTPRIQNKEVDKWIAVFFGSSYPDNLTKADVTFHVCTRKDPEGYRLSQMRDKILGEFFDHTRVNGIIPVPFYQSHPTNPWTIVGYMYPSLVWESGRYDAEDDTIFKSLLFNFKWAAKI